MFDIACAAHGRREEPAEGLTLRRAQHERTPTSSSYRRLRTAAEAIHAWSVERDAARRVLSDGNLAGLVDGLLDDGEDELAWQTATGLPDPGVGDHAWLRLAEVRQKTYPAQALPVDWRLIDSTLETTDRRAYNADRAARRGQAGPPRRVQVSRRGLHRSMHVRPSLSRRAFSREGGSIALLRTPYAPFGSPYRAKKAKTCSSHGAGRCVCRRW